MTEAHETGDVAELVCSNSLKSDEQTNAHGLLKAELRVLGSVLLECAERARVPGGKALVVDRRRFSAEVQRALDDAGVEVIRQEVIEPDFTTKAQRHEEELDDPDDGAATKARKARNGPDGESADCADYADEARKGTDSDITVVATGPLTSQTMADALQSLFGVERLFFHDAIAPIVSAESLDMARIFEGSRYGAGDGEKLDVRCEMSDVRSEDSQTRTASGYLNCPMSEEEYERFVTALLEAELYPLHEFESALADLGHDPKSEEDFGHVPRRQPLFFEGCLPVEEIARRGRLSLAYGPMKPVGLVDPRAEKLGQSPGARGRAVQSPFFAVVQLRRENAEGTMYNIVGFQTRLRQGEQERVFRMIPGLENATFLRFGSIHRNTYIDSPRVLLPTLQARVRPDLLIAGQLTGVEGYVESIGAGLVAGINAARLAKGEEPVVLPREMMMGSLLAYTSAPRGLGHDPNSADRIGSCPARFQPMNANFGLLPGLEKRLRGRDKRSALAERALEAARGFALTVGRERA
jgi:methylenetetrahydrofolate--tRNA-(uracil-5-)-methyltransferase